MTAPVFILDGPQYHQFRPGTLQRFEGVALAVDGDPLVAIDLVSRGATVAHARVNLPSPALAGVPAEGAASCRFECDLVTAAGVEYEFVGRLRSGASVRLFVYAPDSNGAERMHGVAERVLALPQPPPDVVAVTQGGTNADAYTHSCISGFFSLASVLRDAGRDPRSIRSVLDIGCGTGRLLLGWHADDPSRTLAGADINPDLIGWARRELPQIADWRVSNVKPPLDFAGASFDLIQLTSVFTHLPLPVQRAWLGELRRLVKPDGVVVITLHGDLYVKLLLDAAARDAFERAGGYAEFAGADPGANAFSTFHARPFAERLFGEHFRVLSYVPRGNDPARPTLFPFSALQDVYVLV